MLAHQAVHNTKRGPPDSLFRCLMYHLCRVGFPNGCASPTTQYAPAGPLPYAPESDVLWPCQP